MNFTSLVGEISMVCLVQDIKMGGEAIPTTAARSYSHSTPVFHCVKHDISLGITLQDTPTPNYICWRPLDLQAMEGTSNALRLTSCMALFYAPVDVVYKHEHSIVLCARQHSIPILQNSPLGNPAWSHNRQNHWLQVVHQATSHTYFKQWDIQISGSSKNQPIDGQPKVECNIF